MRFLAAESAPVRLTGFVAAALLLGGCSGENISRHQVAGKVTFKGQPVASGAIIFEPEEAAGKIAPTCYARIENGEYKTAREESPSKGPYRVRVQAADREHMIPHPDGSFTVPLLTPEYHVAVQIPPPQGKLDVDIPDQPAKKNK